MKNLLMLIFTLMCGVSFAAPLTPGKVPRAKTGSILMDGTIYDNGNVGIGSLNPRSKLDIDGVVYATTYYGSGANLTDVSAEDTNAGTICAGGDVYLNGEGACVTIDSSIYQAADSTLTDIADGTITENLVNTTNPWADNEVSDTLTASIVVDADKGDINISSGSWLVDSDSVALGTDTTGNYVNGVTASRGLLLTGTEGGTLGLIETCNSGELLKWNGSAWACATDTTGAASGTPGGSTTQIQFNDAGVLNGVDGFVYNGTALSYTGNIGLGSVNPTQKLDVSGTVKATGFTGNLTGNASTASALAADPANCASSGLAGGVTAAGVAEGCYTVSGSGTVVALATAPVFTTPNIGVSTATSVNKVTITAPATSATLTIADGKTLTATNTVNLNTMTDGKYCTYSSSGTALNCASDAGSGLSGLTAGKIPKASSSSTIVDSVIYENTNVGIGTTVPLAKLEIIGAGTTSATSSLEIMSSTRTDLFRVQDGGNIGIGSSAPAYKLDVNGAIRAGDTGNSIINATGGNVGVGSTSPGRLLDVAGSIELDQYIYTSTHYCYASGTSMVCAAR